MLNLSNNIIAFIGAGNMTRSLLQGLVKHHPAKSFIASNRSPTKLNQLAADLGIRAARTNGEAIAAADVVILAVKPQFIKDVCLESATIVAQRKPLVISLAAATGLTEMSTWLGVDKLPIIRTMTNTATAVGMGTTAMVANEFVDQPQRDLTQTLFNLIGTSFWLQNEPELTSYTPLIGCAPAYLYLLIEAMQKAAISRGIPQDLARKIALQSIVGAAELARQSDSTVEELRRAVTTPKGITEASLEPLFAGDYFGLFEKAFERAEVRSNEIEQTLKKKVGEL